MARPGGIVNGKRPRRFVDSPARRVYNHAPMSGLLLTLLAAPALSGQDRPLRERLRDPAEAFRAFQEFVRAGEFGKAHELLSGPARRRLPYEAFVTALTAYETSGRLLGALRVHGADAAAGRLRVCAPEFGFGRDLRVARLMTIWVLDLTPEDLEYFKDRALAWHRHQVKRADGWHFAYPPDWDYAPLARACICGT